MKEYRPLPLEGFEHYLISNNGEVINSLTGYIKKLQVDKDGYYVTELYNKRKVKHIGVHRLVALAFIPNPNNYKEVNHIDNNPQNNTVSNLEWCSRLQNEQHKWKTNYEVAYRGAMKGINKMNGKE